MIINDKNNFDFVLDHISSDAENGKSIRERINESEKNAIESIVSSYFGLKIILDLCDYIKRGEFSFNQIFKEFCINCTDENNTSFHEKINSEINILIEISKNVVELYEIDYDIRRAYYKKRDLREKYYKNVKKMERAEMGAELKEIAKTLSKADKSINKTTKAIKNIVVKWPFKTAVINSIALTYEKEISWFQNITKYLGFHGYDERIRTTIDERMEYHKRHYRSYPKWKTAFFRRNEYFQEIICDTKRVKDEFIELSQPFVLNIIKEYIDLNREYDEHEYEKIVQATEIGFKVAINEYDFQSKNFFTPFAEWKIRLAILKVIIEEKEGLKDVPEYVLDKIFEMSNTFKFFFNSFGYAPTYQDFSEKMQISLEETKLLLNVFKNPTNYEFKTDSPIFFSDFKKQTRRKKKQLPSDKKEVKLRTKKSLKSLSDDELQKRIEVPLEKKPRVKKTEPKKIIYLKPDLLLDQTSLTKTIRNPYIVELAKRRAKGFCQLCENPAPFINKDGEGYLETHHIDWLSKGGEDVIENVVALCPNCHRKMHVLDLESDINKLKKIATRPAILSTQI